MAEAPTGCEGVGKPEELKHDFGGYWSLRITDEPRLVSKHQRTSHAVLNAALHDAATPALKDGARAAHPLGRKVRWAAESEEQDQPPHSRRSNTR